jgi:hypothetical protein
MVSHLIELYIGDTYSVHSEFRGANVGEKACVVEYTDFRMVVQCTIVEAVGFGLVPSGSHGDWVGRRDDSVWV